MKNSHSLEIVLGLLESIEEIKEAIITVDKHLALFLIGRVKRRIFIIKNSLNADHVLYKIALSLQCGAIDELDMQIEAMEAQ